MAYPQVQSVTPTTVASSSTTHNVNMPATVNAGDLLLTIFASDSHLVTVTTPSSWTLLGTGTESTGSSRLSLYGKVASGSEDSTTVNFVTSTNVKAAAQVYRITGWFGNLTTSSITMATASGESTTPNPPNLDPANWGTEETLWIASAITSSTVSSVSSYPSSYTDGTYTESGHGSGLDVQLMSARRENSVSAENPGTFTINVSAAWLAVTIAIRPQFVSQTIELPLLSNTPTFYDAAFSQEGLLILALLDGTPTLYSPTFVYEQLLMPDVLTNTPVFYGPAVATVMSAPLIDGTPTFYSVEIINTQVLTVPLISNSPTFYGPEFRGPQNVEMPLISNTSVFYGPYIFGTWRDVDLPYGSGEW